MESSVRRERYISPAGAVFPQYSGRYRRGVLIRVHVFRGKKHGGFRQEDLQPTRAMDGELGGPEGEAPLRCPMYCGGHQGWRARRARRRVS